MTAPITLTWPMLPPSTNNLFVNVGRRRVRSAKYKNWFTEAGFMARAQSKQKIEGPFAANFYFVRPDNRRRDLDNLNKAIFDLLKDLQFITDDSECQEIRASWAPSGPAAMVTIIPCLKRGITR